MTRRIGHVVERSKTPNAEDCNDRLFPSGNFASNQAEPTRGRTNKEDDCECNCSHSPIERSKNCSLCDGCSKTYEHDHHQKPFNLFGKIMQVCVIVASPFSRPKRQGCDKHANKTVAMDHLYQTIAQAGDTQRNKSVASPRKFCPLRQTKRQDA